MNFVTVRIPRWKDMQKPMPMRVPVDAKPATPEQLKALVKHFKS